MDINLEYYKIFIMWQAPRASRQRSSSPSHSLQSARL